MTASADLDEVAINSVVVGANIDPISGIGFPGWTGAVLQYINGHDGQDGPTATTRPTSDL